MFFSFTGYNSGKVVGNQEFEGKSHGEHYMISHVKLSRKFQGNQDDIKAKVQHGTNRNTIQQIVGKSFYNKIRVVDGAARKDLM